MDKMNEIIKIEGLRKRFGDNEVLKGITTSVRKGEVVAIIGPSGCGKSTFLRSINLLEEPTEGKIFIDDMDITSSDVDINRMRQFQGRGHLAQVPGHRLLTQKQIGRASCRERV